jgi:hypothetical protein
MGRVNKDDALVTRIMPETVKRNERGSRELTIEFTFDSKVSVKALLAFLVELSQRTVMTQERVNSWDLVSRFD